MADGHIWYDKAANIGAIKKIVVFPVVGKKSFTAVEDVWKDSLSKSLKNIHFTLLTPDNNQLEMLLQNNDEYLSLLKDFPSEEERARAVKEVTGADAYLVCNVRENYIQKDWSPETRCLVTLESYTEDSGGPEGYKRYDESRTEVYHTVCGRWVYLNVLNLDFSLYNNEGRKILLSTNSDYGYGTNEEELFKKLLKGFNKELKVAVKDKGKW